MVTRNVKNDLMSETKNLSNYKNEERIVELATDSEAKNALRYEESNSGILDLASPVSN